LQKITYCIISFMWYIQNRQKVISGCLGWGCVEELGSGG
jgi:hypothetical protein